MEIREELEKIIWNYEIKQDDASDGYTEWVSNLADAILQALPRLGYYNRKELECYSCGERIEYEEERPHCYCNSCLPMDGSLQKEGYYRIDELEVDEEKIKSILLKWESCCKKGKCCSSCIEDKEYGYESSLDTCCCRHQDTCDVLEAISQAEVIKRRV